MKCGHDEFETGEFRATGGALAKIFDVQNKKFSTVTCTHCSFTEIYRGSTSTLGNVFDFFTN
jgi:predicted nucleic-acid-binding Zn-ribbon protein